jgi:CheY-like chemotaxis protein
MSSRLPADPFCRDLSFLVVEDHEIQRKVVSRLLTTLGAARVHEAPDGPSALKLAAEPDLHVDIVVSDLSMPGMNGLQVAEALGRTRPGVSLILFSALGARMLQTSSGLAAATQVRLLGSVTKPLTRATLAPLIEAHRSGPPAA